MRGVIVTSVCLLTMIVAGVCRAQSDALGVGRATITGWSNVSSRPLWVSGKQPLRRRHPWAPLFQYKDDRRQVTLAAGEFVKLRLPARELLRVQRTNGPLSAPELIVHVDNGSGLVLETQLAPSNDGTTRFLDAEFKYDRIVTLTRAAHAEGKRRYAIFVSNSSQPIKPARSMRQIDLDAAPVTLQWRGHQRGTFYRLDALNRYAFEPSADNAIVHVDVRVATEFTQRAPSLVTLHVDGKAHRRFHVWPSTGESQMVYVDQCASDQFSAPTTLAWRVPAGANQVTISTSVDALVRLRERSDADYLLPRLNANRHRQAVDDDVERMISHIDALSVDSLRDDAGLVAARYAHHLAREKVTAPSIIDHAMGIYRYRTFYRQVYPRDYDDDQGLYHRWYAGRRLRRLNGEPDRSVIGPTTLDAALNGLSHGVFHRLGRLHSLEYALPDATAGSWMKIAVDRQRLRRSTQISVQFDELPPRQMQVVMSSTSTPEDLAANKSLAAARLLAPSRQSNVSATQSGAFDALREAAPMTEAAWIELEVPPGVTTARLIANEDIYVSANVRVGKPFRVDDRELIARHRSNRAIVDPLLATLLEDHQHQPASAEELRLAGHWRGLVRYLADRHQGFSEPVRALNAGGRPVSELQNTMATAHRMPREALRDRLQFAVGVADQPAIVSLAYSLLADHAEQDRAQYLSQLVAALDAQHEFYLADRLLRSVWLFDPQAEVQARALALLKASYDHQPQKMRVLVASEFVRSQNMGSISTLLESLVDAGEFNLAIDLAYASKPDAWPIDALLSASVVTRRWFVFADLLTHLKSPVRKSFWEGYRAQTFGDYDGALSFWNNAGADGEQYKNAMAQGHAIKRALSALRQSAAKSHAGEQTYAALRKAWHQYQRMLVDAAGGHWRSSPFIVRGHAGVVPQFFSGVFRHATSFKGKPGKPIEYRIDGPAMLRFDMRLIYPRNEASSADDEWISIAVNDEVTRVPVLMDQVVDDLIADGVSLGRLQRQIVYLDPGEHRIAIHAKAHDIAVIAGEQRARLPLSIVPFSPNGLRAGRGVYAPGDGRSTEIDNVHDGEPFLFVDNCAATPLAQVAGRYRMPAQAPMRLAAYEDDARVGLQVTDLQQNLWQWLWAAEGESARHGELLVNFSRAIRDFPRTPEIDRLFTRFKRNAGAGWRKLDHAISASAVHIRDVPQYQSESPGMRTRGGFLPQRLDEYLIGGDQALRVAIHLETPRSAAFDVALRQLPFLATRPQQLMYAVNGSRPRYVPVAAQLDRQRVEIDLPAGDSTIDFAAIEPVANQFMAITDVSHPEAREASEDAADDRHYRRRFYHVATPDEPVEIAIEGPTVLRSHRSDHEATVIEQHIADQPWQVLTFAAVNGRPTLYRFFEQTLGNIESRPRTETLVLTNDDPLTTVTRPLSKTTEHEYWIDDASVDGEAGRGTWAAWLRFRQRIAGEDDDANDDAQPHERFLELRTLWRHHDRWSGRRYRGTVLLREREIGRPVLALLGAMYQPVAGNASWLRGLLGLDASIWMQGAEAETGLENAYAANIRLRYSLPRTLSERVFHTPRVQVFARDSSIERLPRRFRSQIDRDIYTPYRRDHDWGIGLSERITLVPKLDTRVDMQFDLISNPTLDVTDLDYAQARIGVGQLFGRWHANLSYRYRRYFEDEHRAAARSNRLLNIGLSWRRWTRLDDHIALEMNYSRDLSENQDGFWLGLRYAFTRNRGFRDYLDRELVHRPSAAERNRSWRQRFVGRSRPRSLEAQHAEARP